MNIALFLEMAAEAAPARTALVCDGRRFSYAELLEGARVPRGSPAPEQLQVGIVHGVVSGDLGLHNRDLGGQYADHRQGGQNQDTDDENRPFFFFRLREQSSNSIHDGPLFH